MRMLDSEEAARRLGVKLATLYAYVSRGLISSERSPDGRRSLFAADDVERLARRARGAKQVETRLATVTTSVTQLREDGPAYRGVPATSLVASATFEEVAELLWAAGAGSWDADPGVARVLAGPLGAATSAHDRIRLAVVLASAHDPVRADLRPEAVARAARRTVATVVDALAGPAPEPDATLAGRPAPRAAPAGAPGGTIAERLARRRAPEAPLHLTRAINAILVLLADHELATSTLAVRIAASTRADCYDALLAGLGTIAGPLHGAAGDVARRLLDEADVVGVDRALDETLRRQGAVPGFGHPAYEHGDPRFVALRPYAEALANERQREVLDGVVDRAAAQGLPPPNVDLAIAAVARAAGLVADAAQTLFTVARLAGWVAHYLEELQERPLRFRARAVYAFRP
ncbi:MAG TPA: citrate/2-methylcitrate synthase [Acidimicrobiales bacterium]|nr:citrate/2-methylcitrate synthase [Acidimicrobiales bacterium]